MSTGTVGVASRASSARVKRWSVNVCKSVPIPEVSRVVYTLFLFMSCRAECAVSHRVNAINTNEGQKYSNKTQSIKKKTELCPKEGGGGGGEREREREREREMFKRVYVPQTFKSFIWSSRERSCKRRKASTG